MPTHRRPCANCGVNRAEKFYRTGRSRVCTLCQRTRSRASARDQRLIATYGITSDDYKAQLAAQGGVCAGCLGTRRTNLDVDHDHKKEKAGLPPTECLRGLLCRTDNKILAMARDDPARLRRLADYLDSGGVWAWPSAGN